MKRVVITGIGAVTPMGLTFRASWEGVVSGRSGIGPLSRFDSSDLQWKTAGEVTGFDSLAYLTPKETRRLDPFARYAVAAACMAASDAGLDNDSASLRAGGVIIGSSRGGVSTVEDAIRRLSVRAVGHAGQRLSPYLMPATTIGMAAAAVSQKLLITGHCSGVSSACASGAAAIGDAFRLLRSGHPGPVFAGGSEAPLCRTCIEGYGSSGALSRTNGTSAVRPFDTRRDGFVLAEGACILVLEELGHARSRGAHIYAEVTGYGNTADAFHQTRPDRCGEERAIRAALAEAGTGPDDVDCINAHATGTRIGDRTEAEALETLFGRRTADIPVTAIKSMTGHMLAASGSFEAACTAMSLQTGITPPTPTLGEQDSACRLGLSREATKRDMRRAITNSFGFGGMNVVLALAKVD